MPRTPTALVEPAVLRWARESIGLIPVAASRKMNLPDNRVARWEAGKEQPTIAQLRTAARVYKRPLAVFFLPVPPTGFDVMRDFRRVPEAEAGSWSPALHGEYRRAQQQREFALEIAELADEPPSTVWRVPEPVPGEDEALARRAREVLQATAPLPVPTSRSAGSVYEHLGYWISALEEAGVLVFASQGVETDEMRAFSLYFDLMPVIVVNGKDFPRGRLFSLLHEYAHLVLHTAGLCDTTTDQNAVDPDRRLEARCNAVAAAILMPRTAVLALKEVKDRPGTSENWDNDTLSVAAATFGVSSEAFLRRLLTLGKTTSKFYQQKRQELLRLYQEEADRRRDEPSSGNYYRTRVRDLGKGYVRLVTNAQQRRLIDTYTAASFLNVKVQQLGKLAELAALRDVA
jgi:Zn-dependent peptidase ImmA (M78 family)